MAISENTRPAWAGKTDEAKRLISKSLIEVEAIAAGLRYIQRLSDRKLAREFNMIRGAANDISDVECCVDAILESVPAKQ